MDVRRDATSESESLRHGVRDSQRRMAGDVTQCGTFSRPVGAFTWSTPLHKSTLRSQKEAEVLCGIEDRPNGDLSTPVEDAAPSPIEKLQDAVKSSREHSPRRAVVNAIIAALALVSIYHASGHEMPSLHAV